MTYEENGCANIVDAIGKQNKNLGEVVRSWHKSLMATYPNSKTRKSKLSRLNRFLRWTG